MTQEEADKQKGYRFFMHRESKRLKQSPENTNSETPTTNRHTSKRKEAKDE
jgi:hypothetical protein